MSNVEDEKAAWTQGANEVVAVAHSQGVDLTLLLEEWMLVSRIGNMGRIVQFKREGQSIRYSFSANFNEVPAGVEGFDPSIFRGFWQEGGYVDSIEVAFELAKALLVDWSEHVDLPQRTIISWGSP